MKRFAKISLIVLSIMMGSASPVSAVQQTERLSEYVGSSNGMPYVELSSAIAEDKNMVREFFMYSCAHCRDYNDMLTAWGKTLPQGMRYEKTPVVTSDSASMYGAFGYYLVLLTAPAKIEPYSSYVFNLIHNYGAPAGSPQTYIKAALKMGISKAMIDRTWHDSRVTQLVERAAKLTEKYGVKNTPSLTVGGKYLLSPEVTGGEYGPFLQLANGVVTKHLKGW